MIGITPIDDRSSQTRSTRNVDTQCLNQSDQQLQICNVQINLPLSSIIRISSVASA